ncbi:MAG: hypothetical protein ACKVP0_06715 [Pirellulaceae bacterium]
MNSNTQPRQPRSSTGPLLLVLFVAVIVSAGCSRAHYRRQADAEAFALTAEKVTGPHSDLGGHLSIAIDPRSRMFDPYNPDRPPIPDDDPEAHQFMKVVDGKHGWPFWHDNGERPEVENPAWMEYLEFDETGKLVISGDDAVRLGLINSREYQAELEQMYLSALDVSFERFRFDSQGFAGWQTFFTADGRQRSGGGGQSSSLLTTGPFSSGSRPWAVQKAYTTGSTLVVGFANSLIWQFSGPDDYRGNTLIDFALVQPVLRNAGRDRIMERLTVAERTLLYNVRAMEQYRQGFYLQVMVGASPGSGPSRRGGVLGAGLEGFQGIGGSGFGNVSTITTAGGGPASGGGAGAQQLSLSYLSLLQTQQNIRNQEENVERLRSNLFRLEQVLIELRTRAGDPALVDNILRQDLQVAQARQALFNSESTVLNSRASFQDNLDAFKFRLGLPPGLCMDVKDDTLSQFQLIDRETVDEQRKLDSVTATFGEIRLRITSHITTKTEVDPANPANTRVVRVLEWYPELEQDLADLKEALKPAREIRERMLSIYLPRVKADIDSFEAIISKRKAWVARLKAKIDGFRQEPCPLLPAPDVNQEVFRVERLDREAVELRKQLSEFTLKVENAYGSHLQQREEQIDSVLKDGKTLTPEKLFIELYEGVLYPKRGADPATASVPDIFVVLPADILALQLVQARARTESVDLNPVDMRAEQALEVARRYRRDWMNARAGLVDSWRLIQFNADQLQSSMNLFFSGDIGNTGQNPFHLNSDTGRLRVGVQFDAPITRLSERNVYRQALIEYQQARRSYYAFEDSVARTLRAELRAIANQQINFELQRLAVLEAARQIDRNEDIRIQQELGNQATGATAARDAVSALSDLLTAQNNFMNIWVNYEAQRRTLDYDLGMMVLDNEGIWCDPGEIGPEYGQTDPWLRKEGNFVVADGDTIPLETEDLPPVPPQPKREAAKPAGPGPAAEELPEKAPPSGESRARLNRSTGRIELERLDVDPALLPPSTRLQSVKLSQPSQPRLLPASLVPPPVVVEE